MREKLLDPTGTTERAVDATLAPRLRILHSCDFAVAAIGD